MARTKKVARGTGRLATTVEHEDAMARDVVGRVTPELKDGRSYGGGDEGHAEVVESEDDIKVEMDSGIEQEGSDVSGDGGHDAAEGEVQVEDGDESPDQSGDELRRSDADMARGSRHYSASADSAAPALVSLRPKGTANATMRFGQVIGVKRSASPHGRQRHRPDASFPSRGLNRGARKTAPSFQMIGSSDGEDEERDNEEAESDTRPRQPSEKVEQPPRRKIAPPRQMAARKSAPSFPEGKYFDDMGANESPKYCESFTSPLPSFSDSEDEREQLEEMFSGDFDTDKHCFKRGNCSSQEDNADHVRKLDDTINKLESHVEALHGRIRCIGLVTKVPVAIRSQISKHYEDAYNLSRHIQRTMFCTTQGLHELELRKSNNRTSRDYPAVPDISHVMEPVLHDIFRLSRMPETDALDLAVQAMAKFAQRYRGGEWSADDDSKGKCAADRPADMLLHAMLAKLVKHHNGLAPAWLWEELEGTRAVLECHGLEKGYFEGTFAAFERWQSEGLVA